MGDDIDSEDSASNERDVGSSHPECMVLWAVRAVGDRDHRAKAGFKEDLVEVSVDEVVHRGFVLEQPEDVSDSLVLLVRVPVRSEADAKVFDGEDHPDEAEDETPNEDEVSHRPEQVVGVVIMQLEDLVVSTFLGEAMIILDVLSPLADQVESRNLEQLIEEDGQETGHIRSEVLSMAHKSEGVDEHPHWK